jgi:hypothetical protein
LWRSTHGHQRRNGSAEPLRGGRGCLHGRPRCEQARLQLTARSPRLCRLSGPSHVRAAGRYAP